MVVSFYYDLLSQPCRAVYLFLKANGIDFEDKCLQLTKGDHMSPEVLKKNPFHTVPFIDDDGFVLLESPAILQYLARKFNVAEHWYGGCDKQLSAKIDEVLHWQHTGVRKPCISVFFTLFASKTVEGGFTKRPFDEKTFNSGKEALANTIKQMDEYFLRDNPYLCGKEISIADLLAINELEQLKITSLEKLYLENKKIAAWAKRVQERLEPHWSETMVKLGDMTQKFKNAKD